MNLDHQGIYKLQGSIKGIKKQKLSERYHSQGSQGLRVVKVVILKSSGIRKKYDTHNIYFYFDLNIEPFD